MNHIFKYNSLIEDNEYDDLEIDDLIDDYQPESEELPSYDDEYGDEGLDQSYEYNQTNSEEIEDMGPTGHKKIIMISKPISMKSCRVEKPIGNGMAIDTAWSKFNDENPVISIHFKRCGHGDPYRIPGNLASTMMAALKMMDMMKCWKQFRNSYFNSMDGGEFFI